MHYEVEQDEKNKAHWKARVEEVTTTLERVKKHVADAKAREAAIHDEATKVQKKLLTCFEEVFPHLSEAFKIAQHPNMIFTKVTETLR